MIDFRKIADDIEWCSDGALLPSWQKRGILHGFTGCGAAIPAVHHVKQVHGVELCKASQADTGPACGERITADGLYSRQRNEAVAVKTADCLPILFYHPEMVMAVHAGWRSLAAGIVGAALDCFAAHGVDRRQLLVGLGPCISTAAFEVGPEVVVTFSALAEGVTGSELAYCISKGVADRWHFDLAVFALILMVKQAVPANQMSVIRTCTYRKSQLWHSYRRDGAKAGRNWSFVALS